MTSDLANAHATPTWRDIPQPVKPRAMSPGGRRRVWWASLRTTAGIAFAVLVAWGTWIVTGGLVQNARSTSGFVKALPLKAPILSTNGVLTPEWLTTRLALPKGVGLVDLDLEQLRLRLIDNGQIEAATLTRRYPDRLVVTLSERAPVAKLRANWMGTAHTLLVARDGVVFVGEGFAPTVIDRLPWLDGITLARQGSGFQPVAGMGVVAELVARRRETETTAAAADPRRFWRVISLAALAKDGEIEIETGTGTKVVFAVPAAGTLLPGAFGAKRDFLGQLAKLDYVWDALANAPTMPASIDLTLGREVPVAMQPAPVPPTAGSTVNFSQSKVRREL